MKKHIIALGLGLSLLSFLTVSADNFPSSGINLDESKITINFVVAKNPDGAAYNCSFEGTIFTESTEYSFTDTGWNEDTEKFENLTECFHSAGDYTLNIHLQDNAGNSDDYIEQFTILPGTPTDATLNGTTTGAVADNVASYKLTLVLKDEYGNTVSNQDPKVLSEAVPSNYNANTDANDGDINFREGLQVEGSSGYADLPSSNGLSIKSDGTFNLKALAPSIKKDTTYGTTLSRLVSRTLDFVFSNIKKVNLDGSLSDTNISPELKFSRDIKFRNPVKAPISIPDLALGNVVNININPAYESGAIPATLSNISIISSTDNFCNPELSDEGELKNCGSLDYSSGNSPTTNPINIQKRIANLTSNILSNDSVAITTIVSYILNGKTITYPAGALGGMFSGILNPSEIIGLGGEAIIKFIGADIEGFASVDSDKTVLGSAEDQVLNIGLNSAKTDVYEEIVKNGFALARNYANIINTNNGGDNLGTLFTDKNVVVVKDTDFSISGNLPTGKNTLVIINGNLKITGNLTYQNSGDSFGVILLRTSAEAYPTVGNILVDKDVQKIAGSYFADGGFMNSVGNDQATPHLKQLLLTGSLLSRNTLGGSIKEDSNGNKNFTPWGSSGSSHPTTKPQAEKYDLHFVRRYDQSLDNGASAHVGISRETNTAAFIIRPDGKVNNLAPPGFKIQ